MPPSLPTSRMTTQPDRRTPSELSVQNACCQPNELPEERAGLPEGPGFISIVTGFVGLRGFTVTAWEDEAALGRALAGHHADAMRELFSRDFAAGVWTSVWTPGRINRAWLRCRSCRALEDVSDDHRQCTHCAAPLPPRPPFW